MAMLRRTNRILRRMNSDHQENKICRYCAENIPVAAKLCPRCRQWLTFRSFRNPVIFFVALASPVLAAMGFFIHTAGNFMNRPPYYSDFKDSIRILQSNMNWVETSDGPLLFVTGILTNRSQIAWKEPEFECRFFNSRGQLVDALNQPSYLTILPGADSAFRLSIKPALGSNDYSSFKVSISNARNARNLF